jgi:glycosyltransferase involved in cell wall biosynthesis
VLLPATASEASLRLALQRLEGIIFFERPAWHPLLLPTAKAMGLRTVCVPNWEWFQGKDPLWQSCDFFACPHLFAHEIVRGFGFRNSAALPWTLDLSKLPPRKIEGPARLFFHNAGLVDGQDRKGTRDVIRAFAKSRRDDIRLIIRMQRESHLPPLDQRMELRVGNLTNPGDLYAEGDVAIQPSKMEGIGFMVLEPVVCGIPTITLDYPPMNEFVTDRELLVRKLPFKRRAIPTDWVKHAHLRLPSIRDLTKRIEWCAANDLSLLSRIYSSAVPYALPLWCTPRKVARQR